MEDEEEKEQEKRENARKKKEISAMIADKRQRFREWWDLTKVTTNSQ